MGDGDIGGGAAGGAGELRWAPLEALPGGVLVRVHPAVGDADGGDELALGGAEAADEGRGLVGEVDSVVEIVVGGVGEFID